MIKIAEVIVGDQTKYFSVVDADISNFKQLIDFKKVRFFDIKEEDVTEDISCLEKSENKTEWFKHEH